MYMATSALLGREVFGSEDEARDALQQCAKELVPSLVLEYLRADVNTALMRAISIGANPAAPDIALDMMQSIEGSLSRIASVGVNLTAGELRQRAAAFESTLSAALADGSWIKEFPGRLIIRRYADRQLNGKIDASLFANAVLDKMVERARKPLGMRQVLEEILAR